MRRGISGRTLDRASADSRGRTRPRRRADESGRDRGRPEPDQSGLDGADRQCGVTGYRVERCQGSTCTNFAQVGTPTATSFSDTGLSAATTYRYRVRAADAAGNLGAYSTIVERHHTVRPRFVSTFRAHQHGRQRRELVTDDAGLDCGDGRRRGDRIRRGAVHLVSGCTNFTPVGTPIRDVVRRRRPGGEHHVSVPGPCLRRGREPGAVLGGRERVDAGCSAGASPAWWWGIRSMRGRAPSVADVSGSGNTGSLVGGASWSTQGRYGGAMSFDGSSSVPQAASSPSLGLSTAMTFRVDQAGGVSGWLAGGHAAAAGRLFPECEYLTVGRCGRVGAAPLARSVSGVSGPTASPVGSWTHLALTYDGSLSAPVREWRAGRRRSRSRGVIQSSSNPFWVGDRSSYGEFFNGLIDDVRVYNRALTQAEIQTDMATPLGS